MGRMFLGIDNGVSGTIGVVSEDGSYSGVFPVPVYKCLDYTKKTRRITHVDYDKLKEKLQAFRKLGDLVIVTERPFVTPRMFRATISSVRAHEILLAVLRTLGLGLHATWDSREWQHEMLGKFEKGESKARSEKVGCRLYPGLKDIIHKNKDADGLIMAHCLRKRVLAEEKSAKNQKKEPNKET